MGHRRGDILWNNLQLENIYSFKFVYRQSQSKLPQVLFSLELSERLKDTGVTVM